MNCILKHTYKTIRRVEYCYTYNRRILNTGIHVLDVLRTGIQTLDTLNTISQAAFPHKYSVSNLYKNIII